MKKSEIIALNNVIIMLNNVRDIFLKTANDRELCDESRCMARNSELCLLVIINKVMELL